MKLQLKGARPSLFASNIGPMTEGNSVESLGLDVSRVLEAFRVQGHDPFTRRDLVAVLGALGWDEEWVKGDEGAWHKISDVIGEECTSLKMINGKKCRGYYTQGSRVQESAPKTTVGPVRTEGLEVVAKKGLAWAPVVVDGGMTEDATEDAPVLDLYMEDIGLRRMAVEQTPCFGNHSPKASECGDCPLARWCAPSSLAKMRDVARGLDRQFQQEVEAAKAPAPEPVATPEPTEDPTPTEVEVPASDYDRIVGRMKQKHGDSFVEVTLPFEGVCSHCDQKIPKGEKVFHLHSTGMLHPHCAEQNHL